LAINLTLFMEIGHWFQTCSVNKYNFGGEPIVYCILALIVIEPFIRSSSLIWFEVNVNMNMTIMILRSVAELTAEFWKLSLTRVNPSLSIRMTIYNYIRGNSIAQSYPSTDNEDINFNNWKYLRWTAHKPAIRDHPTTESDLISLK
jgi:hypothetical protein